MRAHAATRSACALGCLLLAAGCLRSAPAAPSPARDGVARRGTIEVHLTTGDRARLLAREPDLRFTATASATASTTIATIVVDTSRQYQEIAGFGASLTDASAHLIRNRLSAAQRESLLQELFGGSPGLGLSFTRVDMGASDFSLRHYSYDDMPPGQSDPALANFSIAPDTAETLPILRRALAINPRLTIMASPWSAPAWMKTTGSMITGTLRDDAYAPFALYFRKFIEAYAAEGVPVHAISIQNEPHFEPGDYPGMRLEPAARARFIGRHLGPLLASAGITTQILDWDHNWDQPESPLAVLADSTARRYVAGVAWHCYGGDVSAQSIVHDAHPDKDSWFTECSGGAWSPKFGDNLKWMAQHLIIGSTRHWARGVLMWNLALDETGGPHLGGCGNCRGLVTIDGTTGAVTRNEEYYAFGHASRFVRPGARRLESSNGVQGIETVAFRNADGGSVVLIALNTGAAGIPFQVRVAGRAFGYTLPAGALATFRWEMP